LARSARKTVAELHAEYQLRFIGTDIGPGFSIPAFITLLQDWGGPALALFLLGKHLNEGWEWSSEQFDRLRPFFKHSVRFPREGASVQAVKAVRDLLGHEPRTMRLVGYTPWNAVGGELDPKTADAPTTIEDAAADLWLGVTTHFFLIDADGRLFRVAVEGTDVTVIED
jgi:hypothetical protein